MKFLIIGAALAVAFLPWGGQAFAALYPFGGPIVMILPPLPYGPCPLPSITVGPPRPGVFILPPITLFAYYQLRIGVRVLGLATMPSCGQIIMVGTSQL